VLRERLRTEIDDQDDPTWTSVLIAGSYRSYRRGLLVIGDRGCTPISVTTSPLDSTVRTECLPDSIDTSGRDIFDADAPTSSGHTSFCRRSSDRPS
jgi:hypothetical protein